MRLSSVFLIILVILPISLSAQIDVRLHQPPPNQLMIEDLWWADLNNLTLETFTVYLRGMVFEGPGQENLIFRANSNTFELHPGMTRITPSDITETWDVWYVQEYKEYIIRTGHVPEGMYTFCIFVVVEGTNTIIGEHCLFVRVITPQPPRLISPIDETIQEEYPLFTWIAPVPFPPNEPVIYNLRIVEILDGQSEEEAIRSNIPWFEEENIPGTSLRYPIRAQAFEPGKRYAWQIQATYEGGYPVCENEGRSEIGTFSTSEITPVVTLPKVLLMGGFTLNNITYESGSTLDSLSGKAESFFIQKTSVGSYFLLSLIEFELDFKHLAVKTVNKDTGQVIAGSVERNFDEPVRVLVEDYPVNVYDLRLWPDSAYGDVSVELPYMYDTAGCNFAELGPYSFKIAPAIDIYKELEPNTRGPYRLSDIGIQVLSTGIVVIDLSRKITPSDMGIILKEGVTIKQTDIDTSNTGYLYGDYEFTDGIIKPNGLSASLELASACDFYSVAPMGFQISLSAGSLEIDSCWVTKGIYTAGAITLPLGVHGVHDSSGKAVNIGFDTLLVDTLLNMVGRVNLTNEIQWGGFGLRCSIGTFRLTSGPRDFSIPIQGDSFKQYTIQERDTFPGLTLFISNTDTLFVYSADAAKPIVFAGNIVQGWLNLEMQGISGRITPFPRRPPLHVMLGDTSQQTYLADSAFNTVIGHYYYDGQDSLMNVEFMFAGNSTFDSDLGGQFKIPYPSQIKPPFHDLEVTSTASFAGGKVEFDSAMTLDYWGVDLTSEHGIVSVKLGEIIYMKAAIAESIHYAEPFSIYWGEMLADGDLRKFYFDYNSGNQKFDGFAFTVHDASLSEYKKTSGDLKGYLKTKGDIHFSFWGSEHDTIWDYKYENHKTAPYYSRLVKIIPKFFEVERNWGSGTAYFKFDKVWYDSLDQNGFQGSGIVKVLNNLTGSVEADMDLNSVLTNICFCGETDKVEVGGSITPIALTGFKSGSKIQPLSGCITILGDKLERIYVEGALEIGGAAGYIGIGAAMEVNGVVSLEVTPQSVTIATRSGVSIKFADLLGIEGIASFKLVLGNDALKGDIVGYFEKYPSNVVPNVGLGIQGQFNFYIGRTNKKVYFQGSGEAWLKSGMPVELSAAFFVGANTLLDEIWVLGEIKKGPDARELIKDELGINENATLSGFYVAGKFSYGIDMWLISGGYDFWGGLGCFVSSKTTAIFIGHAGVGIHGDVLGGIASASAWVELNNATEVPPLSFTMCGAMGWEVCCLIWCVDWDGTLCLGTTGVSID